MAMHKQTNEQPTKQTEEQKRIFNIIGYCYLYASFDRAIFIRHRSLRIDHFRIVSIAIVCCFFVLFCLVSRHHHSPPNFETIEIPDSCDCNVRI